MTKATPVFDPEADHGRVIGDCFAMFVQNDEYFAPNGTHIPWDDKFLTSAEYAEKYGSLPEKKSNQVHKPAEDAPIGAKQVIGKPDAEHEPEAARQAFSEELAGYTPMQIKKIVEEAGMKPVTGRGSTAQNIDLLLDKYASLPEA